MNPNNDKRIDLPIPFLKEKTVVYINGGSGYAHRCISRMADILHSRLARADFRFVFLPDLMDQLTPDVLQYLFPGQNDTFSVETLYQRIQDMAMLGGFPGFLYRREGIAYFHILPERPDNLFDEAIRFFIESLVSAEPIVSEIDFMIEPPLESNDIRCSITRKQEDRREREFIRRIRKESSRKPGKICPSLSDFLLDEEGQTSYQSIAEELPDPRISAILSAWEKIEREFGITIEDLDLILGYRVKLSRLSITTAGRILLSDFRNQEVKMDDLTKAIYYYYLRHPDGATLKELHEHQDEILKYYSGIIGRDDMDGIRKSIENLLDPYANNLNVSMSRIKKTFRDVVGDRVARFYYIEGRSGEPRKIHLDRDLVIWEH